MIFLPTTSTSVFSEDIGLFVILWAPDTMSVPKCMRLKVKKKAKTKKAVDNGKDK